MDLRMFGRHFEELYKEAQFKYGIQFIRARLSEAFENPDGSVQIRIEDTLLGQAVENESGYAGFNGWYSTAKKSRKYD